jgi:hypothetical protein
VAVRAPVDTVVRVNFPANRVKFLRVMLTIILLGVFLVGAASLVLSRLAATEKAIEEAFPPGTTLAEEDFSEGCDGLPGPDPCPAPELVDEMSLEGAVERYRQGQLSDDDVVYLMLTVEDYANELAGYLGPASLEPGTTVVSNPLWEATLEGVDPERSFSWVQQWRLNGGAMLFEQVFVVPSLDAVDVFLENHRKYMDGFGVVPRAYGDTAKESHGSVLYRFQDDGVGDPAQRCVNRVIHPVDRAVFVVTLLTGGDCTTPSPELPVGIAAAIAARAELVLD